MLPKYRNRGLTIVPYRTPEILRMPKQEPAPLTDAIHTQRAVVNQLTDEHAEAQRLAQVAGTKLQRAHADLTRLLTARERGE